MANLGGDPTSGYDQDKSQGANETYSSSLNAQPIKITTPSPKTSGNPTPSFDRNRDASPPITSSPSTLPAPITPLSLRKQIMITITLSLTTVITSSSGQILNIALPTIQDELEAEDGTLQRLLSSINLSVGCLLLFSGRVADIYGRKKILILGLLVFTIFSLVGGFLHNASGLIVSRAVTGCGVAMTTPSTTGIIAELFTGRSRSRVFTCFSAGLSLGGILGLLIGGLFVSYVRYTWRSCLFCVAGISFLTSILVMITIPSDGSHTSSKHVDWPGATLITTGLVLFLYAITGASSAPEGWRTSYIICLLILGIILIISFFFWEHYVTVKTSDPPLMRLALWTRARGRLAALYFTSFLAIMGFIPTLYNATLYFQEVQSISPVGTMLRFLPTEIAGILCSIMVALLIHRVPAYWLFVAGLLACGFGNMCFAISEQDADYWTLPFHGMWLIVFGIDFFLPTGLIFVSAFSLPDEYSVASGLFQTIQRLGGSIGLAVTSIIFDSQYKLSISRGSNEQMSYLKGVQSSFWLSAAGCWFGVFVAVVTLRGLGVFGKEGLQRSETREQDVEK
ncbi:uncharacterized protein L199_008377 [Kwoniella botswanensis]|uniref:uncharacterized protein n=1 Tax=Kwoniella botswanensis TaxID=1268659 RepID=UPI00315C8275